MAGGDLATDFGLNLPCCLSFTRTDFLTEDGDLSIFSRANFEGTTATGTYKGGKRTLTGQYPTIQDGIYELNAVIHSEYYALSLENNRKVPTKGENPAYPERGNPGYADEVHIHKGGADWTWSEGCLTIYAPKDDTSRWNRFISMFPVVDYGTRVGSLTLMTL